MKTMATASAQPAEYSARMNIRKKRITIRQGWRKVLPGELLIVATEGGPDGDFVTVNVTSLTLTIARNVSEEDLRADGFTSVEDMVEKMRRFYPDFSEDTEVTIIRW